MRWKELIIYIGHGFNTNTALQCVWQCTEVLYILKYVIVVRVRKKQNHDDTSIHLSALNGKLSLINFSVWFAMRKSGNLCFVLLIELQRRVELYFAFS